MATSYSVIHLGEVTSTQDIARDRFAGTPLLVTASGQTQGRGRGGSEWVTAPRAVAASLVLRPGWDPDHLPLLTLLAGLAAAEVIPGARLKWPNDVLINGDKVAGLLGELVGETVVIGIGINLWWPAPPPGVAALGVDDPDFGPQLVERWAAGVLDLVAVGADAWPIDRYRRLCVTLGSSITWEPTGSGVAEDIHPSGALVVIGRDGRQLLTAATVQHLR